jgi:hypothetical protein
MTIWVTILRFSGGGDLCVVRGPVPITGHPTDEIVERASLVSVLERRHFVTLKNLEGLEHSYLDLMDQHVC